MFLKSFIKSVFNHYFNVPYQIRYTKCMLNLGPIFSLHGLTIWRPEQSTGSIAKDKKIKNLVENNRQLYRFSLIPQKSVWADLIHEP